MVGFCIFSDAQLEPQNTLGLRKQRAAEYLALTGDELMSMVEQTADAYSMRLKFPSNEDIQGAAIKKVMVTSSMVGSCIFIDAQLEPQNTLGLRKQRAAEYSALTGDELMDRTNCGCT